MHPLPGGRTRTFGVRVQRNEAAGMFDSSDDDKLVMHSEGHATSCHLLIINVQQVPVLTQTNNTLLYVARSCDIHMMCDMADVLRRSHLPFH